MPESTLIPGMITLHRVDGGEEVLLRPSIISAIARHPERPENPVTRAPAYCARTAIWFLREERQPDHYVVIEVRETPAEIADLIRDMGTR